MQSINAIQIARKLYGHRLSQAKCVIDATAGNGNDTVFLADNSPTEAQIYAFDIQESALDATKEKTKAHSAKMRYILASHDSVDVYVKEPIDVAVFNLGYLPGGDHSLTTQAATTLVAVAKVLSGLALNGVLAIVAYPGHVAGKDELEQLSKLLAALPKRIFTVGCYQMINHGAASPVLYIIEKVRSE